MQHIDFFSKISALLVLFKKQMNGHKASNFGKRKICFKFVVIFTYLNKCFTSLVYFRCFSKIFGAICKSAVNGKAWCHSDNNHRLSVAHATSQESTQTQTVTMWAWTARDLSESPPYQQPPCIFKFSTTLVWHPVIREFFLGSRPVPLAVCVTRQLDSTTVGLSWLCSKQIHRMYFF